jgi:uncharacterized protein YndB with AHSA1/START domain
METIRHQLPIDSNTDIIYRALSDQTGLAGWWTTDVETTATVGGYAAFTFGDAYFIKMKITELIPGQLVSWECVEGDKEWIGTHIRFRIEVKENRCFLKFEHADWQEATDFFASCNYNWGWYLSSLKSYCETGGGKPYQSRL